MAGGTYDFVVLGGGHNGLISSIYLAKAGFKVCVLEANKEFGGGTRSEEIAPGFIADTGGMVHNLISRTPIVREDELGLFSKYGLEYKYMESLCCSIFPDESHLILYKDMDATLQQIAKFSEKDAETYLEWNKYLGKLMGAAAVGVAGVPPKYGAMMNVLANSEAGMEFLRLMNSSAQQIVEEWFESEEMRVTLTRWCTEMMIDPRQVGTATLLSFTAALHAPGNPGAPFPIGGCVNFVNALTACASDYGVDLFTEQWVDDIQVEGGEVRRIHTKAGDEFIANEGVISTINIKDVYEMLGDDAPA
ncbi:MAG: NAD(P)/FAD-dependent oxidoreductase, partial [Eggerthellaceae bacterium]|nr:NAD(P)/FAD-dependent oxidoreductase [Eggerthellaceae bacterium]